MAMAMTTLATAAPSDLGLPRLGQDVASEPIELVERCGVSASQARWIVSRLQTSRARLELELLTHALREHEHLVQIERVVERCTLRRGSSPWNACVTSLSTLDTATLRSIFSTIRI